MIYFSMLSLPITLVWVIGLSNKEIICGAILIFTISAILLRASISLSKSFPVNAFAITGGNFVHSAVIPQWQD